MTAQHSAGTVVYISATPGGTPATAIGLVTDIGDFGVESKAIDTTDLSDTWRKSVKGLKAIGKISLGGNWDDNDAGQVLLKAAAISGSPYNFQIAYPDTSTDTFSANVLTTKRSNQKLDDVFTFRADLDGVGAPTSVVV
jgi:hypothetical protein